MHAGPVFVGRQRELAELRAGLEDAVGGRGRFFLVVGEAGIGKTRLAEELAREAAERGGVAHWGRCWEGEGAPPYWPWVQVIRALLQGVPAEELRPAVGAGAPYLVPLVPELGERFRDLPALSTSPRSEHARFYLFDAVATLLRSAAQRTPLVLVLDDLQWADAPSPSPAVPRARAARRSDSPPRHVPGSGGPAGPGRGRDPGRARPRRPPRAAARPRGGGGAALPRGDDRPEPGAGARPCRPSGDRGQSLLRRRDRALARCRANARAARGPEPGEVSGAAGRARGDPPPPRALAAARPGGPCARIGRRTRIRPGHPAPRVRAPPGAPPRAAGPCPRPRDRRPRAGRSGAVPIRPRADPGDPLRGAGARRAHPAARADRRGPRGGPPHGPDAAPDGARPSFPGGCAGAGRRQGARVQHASRAACRGLAGLRGGRGALPVRARGPRAGAPRRRARALRAPAPARRRAVEIRRP